MCTHTLNKLNAAADLSPFCAVHIHTRPPAYHTSMDTSTHPLYIRTHTNIHIHPHACMHSTHTHNM